MASSTAPTASIRLSAASNVPIGLCQVERAPSGPPRAIDELHSRTHLAARDVERLVTSRVRARDLQRQMDVARILGDGVQVVPALIGVCAEVRCRLGAVAEKAAAREQSNAALR